MRILPQAGDDFAEVGEDESILIDVLENDLGGAARSLYSVDQDNPTVATLIYTLASGATVSIINGYIMYDPGSAFQHLSNGQTTTDTFTYSMRLGNGAISTATVTVNIVGGGEITPAPIISIDDQTADEGAGTMTFTVSRSGDLNAASSIDWFLWSGTAGLDDATAGSGYGTIHFEAGEATQTIVVTLTDDMLVEGDEAFGITIYNATNGNFAVSDFDQGIGTIVDNDAAPPAPTAVSYTAAVSGYGVNYTFRADSYTQTSGTDENGNAFSSYYDMDEAYNSTTFEHVQESGYAQVSSSGTVTGPKTYLDGDNLIVEDYAYVQDWASFLEFYVSDEAIVTDATLTISAPNTSVLPESVGLFIYAGDGAVTGDDWGAGILAGTATLTQTEDGLAYVFDLDEAVINALLVEGDYVGFSVTMQDTATIGTTEHSGFSFNPADAVLDLTYAT